MNYTSKNNTRHPPWYLFNNHAETIYPALFRKVKTTSYSRRRLNTPDHDFLDLDIYNLNVNRTVIISHGLEGNSQKSYVTGMSKIFTEQNFNCIAWNYRGCSGTPNLKAYSYHSGATHDLDLVVTFTRNIFPGTKIYLIGFSLGGNLVLKYAGERKIPSWIEKIVAISVPMDLQGSCREISKPSNWIYTTRFLASLKKKIKLKARSFPEKISLVHLKEIENLEMFDDRYTAPLNGFKDASDYYSKCSSIRFIRNIQTKSLVINARNDPFLSENCYPSDINRKFITFDYPDYGGHLGFKLRGGKPVYYHEMRTMDFIKS